VIGRIEYRIDATMVGFAPKPKNGSKSTRSAISGRVSIILSIFNTGFAILGCRNTMIPILIPMTVAEKRAILNIYKCSNVRMVNICESHTSMICTMKLSTFSTLYNID
jgi:hypothetical protein